MPHAAVRALVLTLAGAVWVSGCSSAANGPASQGTQAAASPIERPTQAAAGTTAPSATPPTTTPSTASKPPARTPAATAQPDRWTRVYREDFSGRTLPSGWVAYDGPIASNAGSHWSADRVTVRNGSLHLVTSQTDGRWFSGGVMNGVQAQRKYGKYEVRFRIPRASGVVYALLLWPKSERWPDDGEIDFAEDHTGKRRTSLAAVHWGESGKPVFQRVEKRADFTQWHTAGVEWTPGQVVFTLDGEAYSTMKTANTPRTLMNLALQTVANERCGGYQSCIDGTTPASTSLDVDWVAVYKRR